MQKEQLSFRGAWAMIVTLIISNSLVLGIPGGVGQDGWIALLAAIAGGIPVVLMLARMIRLMPEKDIYEMAETVFGRAGGKIVAFLFGFYCFHLAALVLESNAQFIHLTSLYRTPMVVVTLVMLSAALYQAKCGPEVVGRWSTVMITFFLILTMVFFVLCLSDFPLRQMRPVLTHSFGDIGASSLRMATFPFGEAVVIMGLAGALKPGVSPGKAGLSGLLVSGAVLLLVFVRTCAVLGPFLMSTAYFPAYKAASMIELGDFLERIEAFVGLLYLFLGIIKAAICIMSAGRGAAKLFSLPDYKAIVFPVGFGAAALSLILFRNIVEQFDYWNVYRIYAVPFQFLIPVAIWIGAEIRRARGSLTPPEPESDLPQPAS